MDKKGNNLGKSLKVVKGVDQPSYINVDAIKKLNQKKHKEMLPDEYFKAIISGDRTVLSQAITIIESSLEEHQKLGQEIIGKCLPYSGKSIRIGITGIPGVGKSTFIEALGNFLIKKDNKIAVLAVDPSSTRSKGSILGDKTRMLQLSTEDNAYIRPSPSSGTLGGVARKTRETIHLCESAGFDIILIETVGVGQAETTVHSMVDFFLVLMLAGAGDELQGIKRGILELADLLVINKVDNESKERIEFTRNEYNNALQLFSLTSSNWKPMVTTCSSITNEGIQNVWDIIDEFVRITQSNGSFEFKRKEQAKYWLHETVNSELNASFYNDESVMRNLKKFEEKVISNMENPFRAARKLLEMYNRKLKK